MKRRIFIYLIVIISMSLLYFGCSKKEKPKRLVVKINDFYMTEEELRDKMIHSPYSSEMSKNLEEFLDIAIREQVLIQEAQRQGLDKEKTFMKTIERYWAQTLIKELLDKQSSKIIQSVSQEKRDAAMDAWVNELYKKADIKIYNNVLEDIRKSK